MNLTTSVASLASSAMMTSTASMTSPASLTSEKPKIQVLSILSDFLGLSHLESLFLWDWSLKIQFSMLFGTLSFRDCGGQHLALLWNIRVKSQMPITAEHAFKEKSTKLLFLLPLRTIYNRTFQCETPCMTSIRLQQSLNARPWLVKVQIIRA